jgi:SAM-dependent methyltransferase
MSIRSSSSAGAIAGALLLACLCRSACAQDRAPDVPFVPTPVKVVERMIEMAGIGRDDVVYDLGSGDGRMVILAAQKTGARGVGVDINPVWVRDARIAAERAGVAGRVSFRIEDIFKTDVREATVVMLYLLPDVNSKLEPKLRADLKPGTRVISHEYLIGDWPPKRTETVLVNGLPYQIHLWVVEP